MTAIDPRLVSLSREMFQGRTKLTVEESEKLWIEWKTREKQGRLMVPSQDTMQNIVSIHRDQTEYVSLVPDRDPDYVEWGPFDLIKDIAASRQFYPVWISGLSGNGKTKMVEQACATTGREYIRVNFTNETDETDLIGGLRIVGGDTVFEEGPVLIAMKRGAVLLLDEIDAAHTNKVMCLQGVIDGGGIMVKTTNEFVRPAKGFQVFATGNTRGYGSMDGRFIGTNVMNGALLDRFPAMMTQKYPPIDVERDILTRKVNRALNGCSERSAYLIECLLKWAKMIRDSFDNEDVSEVITTRTLVNIITGYSILKTIPVVVAVAVNRFPRDIAVNFNSTWEANFSEEAFERYSDDPNKPTNTTRIGDGRGFNF
jgi:MoxR-like ATPase